MSQVRNIFDQYSQDENKLTHALACALASDAAAVRRFLEDFAGLGSLRSFGPLLVREQVSHQLEDSKAGRVKSIPDILITGRDERLAVAIESKVQAGTDLRQLERHWRGLEKRGYKEKRVLLISVDGLLPENSGPFKCLSWKQVYEWATKQPHHSHWVPLRWVNSFSREAANWAARRVASSSPVLRSKIKLSFRPATKRT